MLHDGETLSVWVDTHKMPEFEKLDEDIKVDVCVVGGGIAGLTTAYLLSKEGKQVCVLEGFELCSGQTGRTTAHFVNALDDRYYELEKLFNTSGARAAAQSHSAAIQKAAQIVQDEEIECELTYLDGYLFAKDDPRTEVIFKEFDAIHRAGLDVELVQRCPFSFFDTGPAIKFRKQMQLHPLKYLDGLVKAIVRNGGRIFTHSPVNHVEGGNPVHVRTKDGRRVTCSSVVVATNTPINDLFAIHTKQAAYRTYVMGFRIPKGSIPLGLYWDTLEPYHYIRTAPSDETSDTLIVGGEDRKTGQDDNPHSHFYVLEEWTRSRFPIAGDATYKWSGQVIEPVDGLGFLGHNPADRDNVYVITGDSGNGMTHCTLGAMIITDQIMNRKNEWEFLYDPSRKSVRALGQYLKENSNAAAQYRNWLAPHPKSALGKLQNDQGTVIRDGGEMIAAYKNKDGQISYCSAVCTHLGGVVAWNDVEKSWDCPVHGSRFDCHGTSIEGPAFSDLRQVEVEREKPRIIDSETDLRV